MINKVTENLVPQVVFTDSDPAMSNAILLIYFSSAYYLCLFHIDLNLKKNLHSKLTIKKNLKEKYSSVSSYLNRQLDSLKTKWAICYINIQFTADANKIQQLLDDEANYIRIQEYKDEIPSVELENVVQKYFTSIEEIISNYLMASMIISVCKQMQECFYYDAFMLEITQWETIIETHTEDNYNEGIREDHYETTKILLGNILATITKSEIMKIWLISSHWYKDDKITLNSTAQQIPISICSNTSNTSENNTIKLNNNRIKYGRAHGIMKKAINLALATNSYEELIGMYQDFLARKQETLDQNQGKPPGRVKSAVEIQDKESRRHYLKSIDLNIQKGGNETQLDNSRDNRKTCQNCGQKGHNCATCKFTG
ncbi:hypothetical protein C1645_819426 [Glomus cerebriforme]|uniref:CCHC-type domain-containing protein n=1 Tax=Glomus cerebriforme TaxID=658196 RepID=A0A397T539_9GLOM|nr:hypothetical protein C1645_819426 [Glomus cerebriforme]